MHFLFVSSHGAGVQNQQQSEKLDHFSLSQSFWTELLMLSLRTKIGLYMIHGFEGVHFCSVWSDLYMSQYKHRLFSFTGRVDWKQHLGQGSTA